MKTTLSVEESAKLIELGVSPTLANVRFDYDENGNEIREYQFSLDCLLAILPKKITDRMNIYNLEIGVWDSEDGWSICYRNRVTGTDDLETYQEAEELIDAVYAMLCWIKTNKIKEL